jgi:hypothetical protein
MTTGVTSHQSAKKRVVMLHRGEKEMRSLNRYIWQLQVSDHTQHEQKVNVRNENTGILFIFANDDLTFKNDGDHLCPF